MEIPSDNIAILVSAAIAVMLLLIISFLLAFNTSQRKKFQYQQNLLNLKESQQNQLIEAAVRSEEIERHRIAETLHDEVGAILSSAKLHLFGIKAQSLDDKDLKLHDKGKELLDNAIQKVRSISHNLHSNILKEFGLNDAIQHFIKMITTGSIIKATVELDENYTTLNAENDISIYRLIQELINNILKHAAATEINIASHLADNTLQISLVHNGNGITQDEFETLRYKKDGLGLKNIQNRIILLRSSLLFSKTQNGYLIHLSVPIKPTTA